MHEKQGNLQEWRIGCVENIPGTYVEDEIKWRIIPLKFLFILVFIFRDSLEDIIVLIKRTSDNGQMKTGGVGEPLFYHCSLRSYLRRNNTRETDDGRTPCAKTQTVKSVFEYIKSLPLSYRRLLDRLEQVASDQEIGKAFRTKSRILIASDGGLYKTWGTHGWIISTGKQVLFKCAGPVDVPFDASSST